MLNKLKLYNFQAHRKLILEFDPRITTIKGPSDVGKSAILRALRWLALNDIGGDDFISWGEKEAVVILEFDRKGPGRDIPFKVVRRKGTENVYKLDGEIYKAFGAGKVPDNIEEALALNEINFQRQHDKPFWLDETAGEVSRQLNRVIDLSVIDTAMANAGKMVRTARERVVVSEDRLAERKLKLEHAEKGTRRIKEFNLVKEKFEKYEAARKYRDRLEAVVEAVDSCDVRAFEERAKKISLLHQKAGELRQKHCFHFALSNLIEDLEEAQLQIVEVPDISKLTSKWTGLRSAKIQRDSLFHLIREIEALEDAENRLVAKAVKCQKLMDAHACPTCGRKK